MKIQLEDVTDSGLEIVVNSTNMVEFSNCMADITGAIAPQVSRTWILYGLNEEGAKHTNYMVGGTPVNVEIHATHGRVEIEIFAYVESPAIKQEMGRIADYVNKKIAKAQNLKIDTEILRSRPQPEPQISKRYMDDYVSRP